MYLRIKIPSLKPFFRRLWTLIGLSSRRETAQFDDTDALSSHCHYQIISLIASGGMGEIYKAKLKGVKGFEKTVAIKTLNSTYADDEAFVSRFIAEAKLVANLVHENIVQIYQLDDVDDKYFFVMEFVNGISLYDFVEFHCRIKKVIPVELALYLASRVARALEYAHGRKDPCGQPLNIIHCDICPHNILINQEGVTKITDFGIAKAATMRETEGVSGKLAFMSPEQGIKNSQLTDRSDIYSLGVVLFYMLSGHYTRDVYAEREKLIDQIHHNYIDWAALPDTLPEKVRRILEKMLATSPDDRYCGASELADELELYLYKDGFGPTCDTLADYMREVMPGRFMDAPRTVGDQTEVLNDSFFDTEQMDD